MPARTRKNVKRRGFQFSATVGRNVPFIGGSSVRLGTRANKAVKKVVRRELNKQEEIKQYYPTSASSSALTHNTVYTLSPIQGLTTGTSANNRVADQIFLRKLVINGDIQCSATQSIVVHRVLVLWTDQQTATTWGFNSVFGTTNIFYATTNYAYAMINNKLNNTIICDRTITAKADIGSEIKSTPFKIVCPIFKKIKWQSGSIYLKDKQLYVVVIPHVAGGSSGVTVAGTANYNTLLTYTDA